MVRILDRNFDPVDPLTRIEYPASFTFHFWLVGHRPERMYPARFVIRDGNGGIVRDESENLVPQLERWPIYFRVAPAVKHEPGEWSFEYYIDGVKIIDKRVPAVRRAADPQAANAVPRSSIAPLRIVFAAAVSRSLEPVHPLETLGLEGAFYYFYEGKGFQAGFNHQVNLKVLDDTGRLVHDQYYGHVARGETEKIWNPVVPAKGWAPGKWTFRLLLDQQLAAETVIEARAGRSVAREGIQQHAVPLMLGTLLLLAAYVGYHLVAFRGGGAPAPGRQGWGNPSLLLLVAANLVPLGLVVLGGLRAGDVLMLYWVENLVVAFYAALRMACARGDPTQRAIFGVPVFLMHFGIFCLVHGLLVYNLALQDSSLLILDPEGVHGAKIGEAFKGVLPEFHGIPLEVLLQVTVLMVSHGFSFAHNFLRRGEYLVATPGEEMVRPYRRLLPIHLVALAGGFFAFTAGSPLAIVVALILLKTAVDIHAHRRSHARKA